MAESLEIFIAAENRASATLAKVSNDVSMLGSQVKTIGGRFKASSELARLFASSLGGTELAAYSGEVAQLSERVSAFSEISKAGRVGALGLQAGLIAAAGVATYKVTEGIASWVMGLKEAQKAADESEKAFQRVVDSIASVNSKRQAMEREDFSLIRDPKERESAVNNRADEIAKAASDANVQIIQAQERLNKLQQKRDSEFRLPFSNTETDALIETTQKSMEDAQRRRDALLEEAAGLRELVGERAKSIAQRQAENAMADRRDAIVQSLSEEIAMLKATSDERLKLEAGKITNNPADQARIEALLKEKSALQAIADFERDVAASEAKADADKQARIESIAAAYNSEMDSLKQRLVLLSQGREAADAYALSVKGFSEEQSNAIMQLQKEVEGRERAQKFNDTLSKIDTAPQQATQGRLLVRGEGGGIAQQQLQAQQKQIVKLEQVVGKLDALIGATKNQDKVTVKQVSVPG